MKATFKFFGLLLLLTTLTFISCNKDDDEPVPAGSDDEISEQITKSNTIDGDTGEVVDLVDMVYLEQETGTRNTSVFVPGCADIQVEIDGMTKIVTIDFGDGCEMPGGRVFKGIIVLEYTLDTDALTRTLNFTFDGFYIDDKAYTGGGTILREWQNDNGNPQSTITMDINILWPGGEQYHRTSEKVREWIEGVGTPEWGDNVYLITGNKTTTFPDGTVNSGIVTTPLRRELACNFIVSGVIALTHNGHTGTLDFGEGECDNIAVFTSVDGTTHIIHL